MADLNSQSLNFGLTDADNSSVVGVLVVDDHPMMRSGIANAVRDAVDLRLVGEAADGAEGLALVRSLQPDVALIDIRMPKLDGIAVCRALKSDLERPHVLLLTASEDPALIRDALDAGAAGFLGKDEPDAAIVSAIRRVVTGDTVVSANLQAALVAHMAGRSTTHASLSDAELKTIRLAATGRSNPEIAAELFVSTGTVKTYLARAFDKLGVSDRAAAAAEAVRRGLIS